MKKIMFNEQFGLQQATFDGTKTMTRRIVPQCILDAAKKYQEEYYAGALEHISLEDAILNMVGPERMFDNHVYKVGEIVAIAQNYDVARLDMSEQQREDLTYADMKHLFYHKKKMPGFTNKMFVRAEWMPHHIRITGFKLEYLQDISEEDALREGIIRVNETSRVLGCKPYYTYPGIKFHGETAKAAFISLIDKLRKKPKKQYRELPCEPYNPIVFVYEFELVD